MSRSRWYCRVVGLAFGLGLLCLPSAYAVPASRGIQDEDPAGIQQVVRIFLRPIPNILRLFQMDNSPGQGDGPPKDRPQEGVGIDPNGRPPGQGPGQP